MKVKRIRLAILLVFSFLFISFPGSAQTYVQGGVQKITDPKTVYTFTFPKPNTAPCTLFISARTFALPVSDSNGNTWIKAPGHIGLWYTTTCASGPNTITISYPQPTYFQDVPAEYSGVLIPRQVSDFTNGYNTSVATSPSIAALAGDLILGSGWTEGLNYNTATAGTGFTIHGGSNGVNVFLEDMIQPADGLAVSSTTYAFLDPFGWHQAVAAFKVSVPPPPPPQPINLAVSGNILFDDLTPVAFGATINVQQADNSGAFVNAGTVTSDSNGAITGSFTVNPILVTTAGFVTFQFSVNGIGATVSQTFLLKEFQQGSTGLNLQLVLFKSVMLPKSFGAGLLP
jgi:hypothetical protein